MNYGNWQLAKIKTGDLTAEDAEGAKEEREKQEGSPQIYAGNADQTGAMAKQNRDLTVKDAESVK